MIKILQCLLAMATVLGIAMAVKPIDEYVSAPEPAYKWE